MKIIIAGAGEVGTYLAKMLSEGNHDIVVMDTDDRKLSNISSHADLLTVNGSATSIRDLKKADIKHADLFIAITEKEEANIIAAILSKRLGAAKAIARIDNDEYLVPANRSHFLKLGIDSIIYPEILASKEILNLLKQTGSTKTFDFSEGKLSLFAIKLDAEAPIINKTLAEVTRESQKYDYRAVAITRNSVTLIPHGQDKFMPSDLVYVISNQQGHANLLKYSGKENIEIKNIMILGGSRIGRKTAAKLENDMNVKLIELDQQKCFELADELENTLVINGDGRNIELLAEEGIRNMDAFVAVTGNSEANILSCVIAKKMGVKKAIAEVENMDYIDLAESMGLDTFINKKLIAASHIYSFTMEAEVSSVQCLTATEAEVLEFVVHENSKITKGKIKDIDFPKGAIIGGVIRGKSAFIAKGDTLILPNDRVVVFALPFSIGKVNDFFV